MQRKIGVVIVNYNGAAYQNECMRTLYESSLKDFEVVVVDSASSDGSVQMLQKEYPQVHILQQSENVGVAKGNNIGIRYFLQLGVEYILLMNNDIELDSCTLEKLLQKADENTITVPKIYYYSPNDLLWFAGGELDWTTGGSYHIGIKEYDNKEYDKEKEISYAPTCCMLIHNSVFERVGMIEEKYFMYYDDTDFCARIQKAPEIKILYVPDAVLWHKVSSSSGGGASKLKIYYQTRNKLVYMNKFKDKIKALVYIRVYFRMLLSYMKGVCFNTNSRIIWKAIRDYHKGNLNRQNI